VYTDNDLPTHYAFQGPFGVAEAIKNFEEVRRSERDALKGRTERQTRVPNEARVQEVISALDAKGRWLRNNRIESRVFIENVNTLCDYLATR
jgi:hypothetical protein